MFILQLSIKAKKSPEHLKGRASSLGSTILSDAYHKQQMVLEVQFGICKIDPTLLGSIDTPPATSYIREQGKLAVRFVVVSSQNP